jgi:indole-3-glycerol phosphate synthase/phosphoribosylanthranilate isomerase
MNRLAEIVARKQSEVAMMAQAIPVATLRAACQGTTRGFQAALMQPRLAAILECKAGSPSAGRLRERYDPVALARGYAGVADAISVLCDGPGFGGSYDDLRAVRAAVALPLLAKDIVVDPYQVVLARAAGADAVLLMLAVLDDASYRACAAIAAELELAVLTEVHDLSELARARALAAAIVGINNRDLRSFQVDLATTERLAPQVDWPAVVVGESGVSARSDVRRLAPHVDALLIGSALSRAERPDLEARVLLQGRTKICGLTCADDARAAFHAGATHGGLVRVAASPRRLTSLEQARQIVAAAPLDWVLVAKESADDELVEWAATLELAAIQLCGDPTGQRAASLRQQLPARCELWGVRQLASAGELAAGASWPAGWCRVVLDTRVSGMEGGSGRSFDWRGLGGHPWAERCVLAGGIAADNVVAADALGLWCLDASSRLECAPGKKDVEQLRALMAARRGGGRQRTTVVEANRCC